MDIDSELERLLSGYLHHAMTSQELEDRRRSAILHTMRVANNDLTEEELQNRYEKARAKVLDRYLGRYRVITPESGSSNGTRLVDVFTGEEICGVRTINARVSVDDPITIEVTLVSSSFEISGNVRVIMSDPLNSGEMKGVEAVRFEDGTGFYVNHRGEIKPMEVFDSKRFEAPDGSVRFEADVTNLNSDAKEFHLEVMEPRLESDDED